MSLPIYQRVAVTDAGDVIPGAEYTVINENTGVAAPIYSDRTGATLLSAPYFADSAGTIQFFIAQGTTFRVAASGGVGTYTDRYVYGVAEAVLVDASGNAEIVSIEPVLKLEDTRSTLGIGDKLGRLDFYGNDASAVGTGIKASVKAVVEDASGQYVGLAFGTTTNVTPDVERVRIDAYGNVGIGTSSLTTNSIIKELHIDSPITNGVSKLRLSSSVENMEASIALSGYLGEDSLSFSLGSAGNGSAAERMRIGSDGHLFVGTGGYVNGGSKVSLKATGSICVETQTATDGYYPMFFFNASNVQKGYIYTTATATSFSTVSDYRLKEDDVPMTGATERVKALRPINFAWKEDGSRVDGFFAHEVQEVVPESAQGTKDAMMDEEYEVTPAVYEDVTIPAVEAVLDEDGMVITEAVEEYTESVLVTEAVMGTRSVPDYQGIDQSKLVPLLTATIQELIARIEALESGA